MSSKIQKYKIKVSRRGKVEEGVFEALDEATARNMARKELGGQIISTKKVISFNLLNETLTLNERQTLFQRLSAMSQSKIGASEALRLISATYSGNISRVSSQLMKYIERGSSYGEAMEAIGPPSFPKKCYCFN